MQGLDPWEKVAVQLFDPNGQPTEWVTEYESYLTDVNENPVTKRSLYADDQGSVSNIYYTDNVPGALTVDLQGHLKLVTDELLELAGLRGDQTPNIYLVDNLDLLKQVSESSGSQLGFADGYYHSGGDDSGVYMHTYSLLTGIQRLLTHEYVHLPYQKPSARWTCRRGSTKAAQLISSTYSTPLANAPMPPCTRCTEVSVWRKARPGLTPCCR